MAKYRFRGPLNAAMFPMVSILQGRTVISSQIDPNIKTPQSFYGTAESAEYNTPQVLYLENVIPTGEGLMSVSYYDLIEGVISPAIADQAITLRDADEDTFLFVPADGANYIYDVSNGTWDSVDPVAVVDGTVVTRAYVNGRTFVCYASLNVYEYNSGTGDFLPVTLTLPAGVTIGDVRGIGASSNYLLIFTDITVYWSSLVDPVDFEPSLQTGAGFATPQDVKGRINAILGISGGFIIYTSVNAVAASYTQNVRAPFAFKEISNAGGVDTYEQITSEQTSGIQYAWTTGGLQKITLQGAESVSAEVSDFLAGRQWEYYDRESHRLIQVYDESVEFPVKLAYIASRYLLVSYSTLPGTSELTNAPIVYNYVLVYDVVLKRWGKLKIDHTDAFSLPESVAGNRDIRYFEMGSTTYDDLAGVTYLTLPASPGAGLTSKAAIGFLQADGKVKQLVMNYRKLQEEPGVVIFGKFQLVRAQVMGLQQLELEGYYLDTITENPGVRIYAVGASVGYRLDQVYEMKRLQRQEKYSRYAKRVVAPNISILVEGTFALSSYLLEVTQEGDR